MTSKAFLHIPSGSVHISESLEGYDSPDWEPLPDPPSGSGPWLWTDGTWQLDDAPALAALRTERNRRLLNCDWTQLADIPEPTREAWMPYRQALRDLPETADLFVPEWPIPPE